MSHHGPVFSAGEFRDCGFSGVDDGRYFSGDTQQSREYTYDDPDYMPGHGLGPATVVDFGARAITHAFEVGLEGPEVAPDFVRNPNQRTDYYGTVVLNNRHWLKTLFDSDKEAVVKSDIEEPPATTKYARALQLDRVARNTQRFIESQPPFVSDSGISEERPEHGYEIHVDRETGDWTVKDF